MKLTKSYKDGTSGRDGCPTVYLAESGDVVVQGRQVDAATFAELENVLPGESAVLVSADLLVGAVERYRARQGR